MYCRHNVHGLRAPTLVRFLLGIGTVLTALNAPVAAPAVNQATVVTHYAVIVHASYEDSLASARTLRLAIRAFVAQPSQETLETARKSWLAAREWYGQTEAFRFYGGPIDNATGPERRLNSWPIDESYIDRVKDNPGAGIINDPKVPINRKKL